MTSLTVMTSLKVTIQAADLWEVRGALHAELSSAAERLQRAADEYWSLERGELPASDDLSASRARMERVLRLLDYIDIEKDDNNPQTVAVDHEDHELLLRALASRAHAIRDQLSDEFTVGYDERAGKAQVLSLMERYERTQALLAVIRDQVTGVIA
ncbi:MAG: hypothetical protein QOK34_1593 [Gaiellaceae bacterium]|jgi:hypothetical protein|nr:hypothetical protein [Gaiellaceae bacterium]